MNDEPLGLKRQVARAPPTHIPQKGRNDSTDRTRRTTIATVLAMADSADKRVLTGQYAIDFKTINGAFCVDVATLLADPLASALDELLASRRTTVTVLHGLDRRRTLRFRSQPSRLISLESRFDSHSEHDAIELTPHDLTLTIAMFRATGPRENWNHVDLTNQSSASHLRDIVISVRM